MNKEKIQLIVIAAGILMLLSIIAGNLKKKPAKGQPPDKKPVKAALAGKGGFDEAAPEAGIAAGAKAAPALYEVNDEELSLQTERAKLDWGRDPFAAAKIGKDFRGASLQLKGISFGKDKSGFAFINNEIVKKGDIMGDYEVLKVEKHKVLLRKAEQTFYLALPQE